MTTHLPDTYLFACLKDRRTVRWPDTAMPIRVYVAPFRWYENSKQQQANRYQNMVYQAMQQWSHVSGGRIRFQVVQSLHDSQIDVKWRRVDRRSLGHCEYLVNDQSMLYSAEIRIGVSDGLLHADYNDPQEVQHTVFHEFGHALGLVGHSDGPEDIMYVPHQYGVTQLSARDVATLQLLYALPVGFDYMQAAEYFWQHGQLTLPEEPVPDFVLWQQVLAQVLATLFGQAVVMPQKTSGPQKTLSSPSLNNPNQKSDQANLLAQHHDILSMRGRFWVQLQNFRPSQRPSQPPSQDDSP